MDGQPINVIDRPICNLSLHPVQEGGEEGTEEEEDKRVTVIETATGTKLTGEDAPLKSELEKWLEEHPG